MIRTEHLFTDPKGPFARKPENMAPIVNSHGASLFGRLLLPGLESPEERSPLVIFLHGYPGGEQNIDLAQDLRRIGAAAYHFSYRGVWGSHGDYSFTHLIEDVFTVVDYFREHAELYRIDPEKILLVGHSMGGFAALNALHGGVKVKGAVLMAPCDIAMMYQEEQEAFDTLMTRQDEGYFHLAPGFRLEAELKAKWEDWRFTHLGESLSANYTYHFIGAAGDTLCPVKSHLEPLLEVLKNRNIPFTKTLFDDGHSFYGKRCKLAQRLGEILKGMEE